MKKIVIFIDDLEDGGAQKVFAVLATELQRLECEVTLVTLRLGSAADKISKDVTIIKLNSSKVMFAFNEFNDVLTKINPDCILTGLLHNNIFLILHRFLFSNKYKLVLSEHSIPSKISYSSLSLTNKLCTLLRPLLYNFADKVVSVSEACRKDLYVHSCVKKSKIVTIHNPIQLASESDFDCNAELNQWLLSKKYFLAVGRLHHSKNFRMLINAFQKSNKSNTHRLLILGSGPEMDALEKVIEENNLKESVILMGYKSNPYLYMKNAVALLITSKYEGFGNVAVEALSCGTPVITTKCYGPEEIIQKNRTGDIIGNNEQSVIDALDSFERSAFDSRILIDQSGRFSKDKIAVKYAALINEVNCQ